jgi:hypothetical protein
MILTAPFVAFGIWRFMVLALRAGEDSPTEAMLRDVAFLLNFALWTASVLAIIYFRG